MTAQEVMVRLQEHGVSAGAVQNTKDLIENDAGFRDRHIHILDHPGEGAMRIHGETIAISGVERVVQRAPLLGENTEYALKELLGMDEREVDQLYVDGVLR